MTKTPQDAGAEIQLLFEQESGKQVVARASSEFSGCAIKVASAASPAHVRLYKPEMESEWPYLTAFQCGLAMRSILPNRRIDSMLLPQLRWGQSSSG